MGEPGDDARDGPPGRPVDGLAEGRGATEGTRTIVLADDHAFTLTGLRTVIEDEPGLSVVGTAANGIEAIALVKRHRPDLAVLDYAMPDATGHEAFVEGRRWSPETRFVIVTGAAAPSRFAELIELGIEGIFLKTMTADEVCAGLRRVLAGERVIAGMTEGLEAVPGPTLTGREREVLEHIARGASSARIADVLCVSVKTVESHRATLMRKMGANNTASLMMRAMRAGLIAH